MTACHLTLRCENPPLDTQVESLFGRVSDLCVEVGAYRRWTGIAIDREARSLSQAVVTAIRDCDVVGLIPLDVGPDDDLVTIELIADRTGCHPRRVLRWAGGDGRSEGFPHPVDMPGGPPLYRWSEVMPWAYSRMGLAIPDETPVFSTANHILRVRMTAVDREDLRIMLSMLGEVAEEPPGRPADVS